MKRIVLAALTLPVFLVGCGQSADNESPKPVRVEEFVVDVPGDTDKPIFSFTTPDGMPCLSNWQGALTCDWSKRNTM